eukprot:CAMPEP_0180226154 /NCGR_PEP_ID=MMETSP0987-20121128/23243_1 /TAXON_ID=697907 /ORGANISM="non described non described, Strain CCMP2293" /LENGTH=322 /DNA_ID=CAMNT_0022189591 /DNA_START=537 /DNA_END=1502 /DNA_ORIENTATION=+
MRRQQTQKRISEMIPGNSPVSSDRKSHVQYPHDPKRHANPSELMHVGSTALTPRTSPKVHTGAAITTLPAGLAMKAQSAGAATVTLTLGTNNLKSHGLLVEIGRIEIQYSSPSLQGLQIRICFEKRSLLSWKLLLSTFGRHPCPTWTSYAVMALVGAVHRKSDPVPEHIAADGGDDGGVRLKRLPRDGDLEVAVSVGTVRAPSLDHRRGHCASAVVYARLPPAQAADASSATAQSHPLPRRQPTVNFPSSLAEQRRSARGSSVSGTRGCRRDTLLPSPCGAAAVAPAGIHHSPGALLRSSSMPEPRKSSHRAEDLAGGPPKK